MTLRSVQSLPPDAVSAVDARLDAIKAEHSVAIPLAVESGSRAWGFASPDSDFDCRFVFVRPLDDYLTPWGRRDVIETPIEGDLDVNGWDLGKALKLLLKGNCVIIEWLTSPIVYGADAGFRDDFLELARRCADRRLVARHYLHLGERQQRVHLEDAAAVRLKRAFYALRPAAALRWLRARPGEAVAPMHFPTLMAECEPPDEVAAIVGDLIAKKAVSRELGVAELPAAIGRFIDEEFAAARLAFEPAKGGPDRAQTMAAEDFFRTWVRRLAPGASAAEPMR